MNDACQSTESTQVCTKGCGAKQFFAIFAAAVVLGLIYNIASPLGVRAPQTGNPSVSPSPATKSNISKSPVTSPATNPLPETNATLPTTASGEGLKWTEVKALLDAGQIILADARAKAAYDIEHIPGAISLPAQGEPAEFIAFAAKYPLTTAIVVYCGGGTCDLSHELREKLTKDLGYTNVKEMPGGIVEWRVAEGKTAPPGAK